MSDKSPPNSSEGFEDSPEEFKAKTNNSSSSSKDNGQHDAPKEKRKFVRFFKSINRKLSTPDQIDTVPRLKRKNLEPRNPPMTKNRNIHKPSHGRISGEYIRPSSHTTPNNRKKKRKYLNWFRSDTSDDKQVAPKDISKYKNKRFFSNSEYDFDTYELLNLYAYERELQSKNQKEPTDKSKSNLKGKSSTTKTETQPDLSTSHKKTPVNERAFSISSTTNFKEDKQKQTVESEKVKKSVFTSQCKYMMCCFNDASKWMRRQLKLQAIMIYIICCLDALDITIIEPILPDFVSSKMNVSDKNLGLIVGLIAGAFSFGSFLSMPFIGFLSDRFGRKPFLVMSLLVNFVGIFSFGFIRLWYLAFVVRFLQGFFTATTALCKASLVDISEKFNTKNTFLDDKSFFLKRDEVDLNEDFDETVETTDSKVLQDEKIMETIVQEEDSKSGKDKDVSEYVDQVSPTNSTVSLTNDEEISKLSKNRSLLLGYLGASFALARSLSAGLSGISVGMLELLDNAYPYIITCVFASSFILFAFVVSLVLPETNTVKDREINSKSRSSKLSFLRGLFRALSYSSTRKVLLIFWLSYFSNSSSLLLWVLLITTPVSQFGLGLTPLYTGLLFLVFGLCCFVFQVFVFKRVIRRFSLRKLLFAGCLFSFLQISMFPLISIPYQLFDYGIFSVIITLVFLLFIAIVASIGKMTLLPIINCMLVNVTPLEDAGLIQASFQATGTLSRSFGPLVVGLIFSLLSFYPVLKLLTFYFVAILYLVCMVLTFTLSSAVETNAKDSTNVDESTGNEKGESEIEIVEKRINKMENEKDDNVVSVS